nr:hypothetical protein Iba_scaffold23790CG0020 [Ipomoea batatas]
MHTQHKLSPPMAMPSMAVLFSSRPSVSSNNLTSVFICCAVGPALRESRSAASAVARIEIGPAIELFPPCPKLADSERIHSRPAMLVVTAHDLTIQNLIIP